jgi:hypothetical protein
MRVGLFIALSTITGSLTGCSPGKENPSTPDVPAAANAANEEAVAKGETDTTTSPGQAAVSEGASAGSANEGRTNDDTN